MNVWQLGLTVSSRFHIRRSILYISFCMALFLKINYTTQGSLPHTNGVGVGFLPRSPGFSPVRLAVRCAAEQIYLRKSFVVPHKTQSHIPSNLYTYIRAPWAVQMLIWKRANTSLLLNSEGSQLSHDLDFHRKHKVSFMGRKLLLKFVYT
jgi:hypothetical protein